MTEQFKLVRCWSTWSQRSYQCHFRKWWRYGLYVFNERLS